MLDSRVIEILDNIATKHASKTDEVESIKAHYRGRMWHQITDELVALTSDEAFDSGSELIQLFQGFVQDLAPTINQLKLLRIAENTTRQFEDIEMAIEFLKEIEPRLKGQKESEAAILFCKVSQADKRLS